MPSRTLPHTRATPSRTGGDDRPATPCQGRAYVYDALIDGTGPEYRAAIVEARAICATCPISTACLSANRGEEWAQAIITGKTLMQRTAENRAKPKSRGPRPSNSRNAEYLAAYNARRLAELEDMADMGLPLSDVLRRVELNRDALRKWCLRNQHDALWDRLVGKVAA